MAVAATHPSDANLEAFSLGTIPDDHLAEIEAHLAVCPNCQERAAGASVDSLVALLQRVHAQVKRQSTDTVGEAAQSATPEPLTYAPGTVTQDQIVAADRRNPTGGDIFPSELAQHERYRVVRLLGEGGMGSVYEAEHCVMQRPVAVKVIHAAFTSRPASVERFRREVRAAARLTHPNIVRTYDAEDAGATLFLVMEYVEGVSLAQLVKERGPLPLAEACDCVRQAALGLQHAHECGMVHRDVKPHNLIRTRDGQVKVLDFGLAALNSERGDGLTDENAVMGTPDYMAPEQAEDARNADIRADVYSLGCTLFFLLTGDVPYPAATAVSKILAHREQPLPSIRRVRTDVPAGLARVMARLLAKKPADRYQTPAEVAAALAPFAAGQEDAPRKRGWLVASAALFLGLLVIAGVVVYRIQTDRGELVISTEGDDVEVLVKQGGKLVEIIDSKTKKKITLRSGVYDLELKGGEGLKLDITKATLTRDGTVLARIERLPKPALPQSKGVIQLLHRVDWRTDGVLYASVSARCRYFACVIVADGPFPRGIRVWDGRDGRFLWDNNNAHCLRFSPDAEVAYVLDRERSGPEQCVVRAYRAGTGELLRIVCRLPNYAHEIHVSDDGQQLRTSNGEWFNIADGKPFPKPVEPNKLASLNVVEKQPGGAHAIAGEDGSLPGAWWVVDPAGGVMHHWLPRDYGQKPPRVYWINERESVVALEDGTVRLFDVFTHKERARFQLPPGEKVLWLDRAADRRFVAANTNKGTVLIFRIHELVPGKIDQTAETILPLHRIPWAQGNRFFSVDVTQDGRYFLASRGDVTKVRIWDTQTGNLYRELNSLIARFTPDGKQVIATDWRPSDFHVYDLATGDVVRRFGSKDQCYNFIVSLDGTKLFNATPTQYQMFDWATGKLLCQIPTRRNPREVLTPDGRHLFLEHDGKPPIRIVDTETGKETDAFPDLRNLPLASFSGDGRRLIRYVEGRYKCYDVATGKQIAEIDAGDESVLSSNGRLLLKQITRRDQFEVWDVDASRLLGRLQFPEPVEGRLDLRVSRDGRYAVFVGPGAAVHVFRLPDPLAP